MVDKFEDIELFGTRVNRMQIHIENSADIIKRGLNYFFGNKAVWLDEYDEIVSWMSDNKGSGLLCIGDGGRGKTVVCERILLPIIQKYYPIAKVSKLRAYTIARDYENSFGSIVFVDDIGVEYNTYHYGERRNIFNQVVDDAERNGWLLIVTTNLTIDEIKEKYGERTLDRLRALTRPVVFKGESLRK